MLLFCTFSLHLSKNKSLEKLINGVSFIFSMYKIYIYCLLKERLGILKVSLCVYLGFGFCGAIWLFQRVDLAFFSDDCLTTLDVSNS